MKKKKLHKEFCEIKECGVRDPEVLHHHHIIERTEVGTNNDYWNCVTLCANCHSKLHHGSIKIIGVFPSTGPHGRTVIYETIDKPNTSGITESYQQQPKKMKVPNYEQ